MERIPHQQGCINPENDGINYLSTGKRRFFSSTVCSLQEIWDLVFVCVFFHCFISNVFFFHIDML